MSQPRFEINADWATAIGRALIAFGVMEHAVHICLKGIARDPISAATSDLNLAKKIEIAVSIIGQYPHPRFQELNDMLREAKSMSSTRNLIAHNPLVYEFHEREDGESHMQERIVSLRDHAKKISLLELQKFSSAAENLSSRLMARAINVAVDVATSSHT